MKNEKCEMLKYLNITVDDLSICEYDGAKRSVSVQLKDIRNIYHEYGSVLQFPAIAFLFGIFMIISGVFLGVWPIIKAVVYSNNVGFLYLKGYGFISLLVFIGFWTVFEAAKKSHLILIETVTGPVKLKLRGEIDENGLSNFLNDLSKKIENQLCD